MESYALSLLLALLLVVRRLWGRESGNRGGDGYTRGMQRIGLLAMTKLADRQGNALMASYLINSILELRESICHRDEVWGRWKDEAEELKPIEGPGQR